MASDVEINPFVQVEHPIAFHLARAEHVRAAVAALLEEAQARLSAVESDASPPSYDSTLGALERVTERLGRAMGVISHLESVATTPELREAYNEVQPKVSAFYSSIPLSSAVFRRLQAFARSDEAARLDPTRARFLEKTLESFEREGAALDEPEKEKLRALNVELSELTTRFAQNVLDSTNAFELVIADRARLAGLPERAIEAAAESARAKNREGYRFTLHEPSLLPVLTYLDDPATRECMYRAYYGRASEGAYDNREVVRRILELRREKARLLGYQHFVDLVLDERMAGNGERARSFLEDLRERSSAAFEREKAELRAFRRTLDGDADGSAGELAPWDVGYYSEKLRTHLYAFDEEALRPYFSLQSVFVGLFDVVQRLYGVRVEQVDDLPVWHPSVSTYRINDADGSQLGVFYADLFPREQKRGGAWMNAFITGEPSSAGWTPHVGLICGNLTPPLVGGTALLSHREVQTVFHEFGHLLHHMLSRVEVKSLAGTSVAWDFVELPSQIMENFCWERATLDLFARHHETGATIPDELLARMQRARTYRGASAMMRQLGFGLVDLLLHMDYDPEVDGDVLDYSRELLQQFSPAPLAEDHALIASFNHLFSHPVGYAGGYYSYKWAEVLDADAFSRFRREGLLSRQVGMEFRDKILARGDSRDPMQLFIDFMGREPDLRALLERSGIESSAAA
jgi:oligopeptidase A